MDTVTPSLSFAMKIPVDAPPIPIPTPQPHLLQNHLKWEAQLLNVSNMGLLNALSSLPVPRGQSHMRWGPPRRISGVMISTWLSGKAVMPTYRLGAAVATLELIAIFYQSELDAAPTPDPFIQKRLDLAFDHHARLVSEPSLQPWLKIYREGIFERLKKDRTKSKYDGNIFAAYNKAMVPMLDVYKEEEQ